MGRLLFESVANYSSLIKTSRMGLLIDRRAINVSIYVLGADGDERRFVYMTLNEIGAKKTTCIIINIMLWLVFK